MVKEMFEIERDYIERNKYILNRAYGENYLAVIGEVIIDHDLNEVKLAHRVAQNFRENFAKFNFFEFCKVTLKILVGKKSLKTSKNVFVVEKRSFSNFSRDISFLISQINSTETFMGGPKYA